MMISAGESGSGSPVLLLQCVKGRLFICASTTASVVLISSSPSLFQESFSRVSSLTSPISHKILPSGVREGK